MAREKRERETFREQTGGKWEDIDWYTVGGSTGDGAGRRKGGGGGPMEADGGGDPKGPIERGGETTPPRKNDRGL